MPRVSDAKERLIEAVIELIWTGSYGSTSVDSICERAGVKKGSFYHFFESKTALALAGIEAAWESHRAELNEIFSPVHPPLERLSNCLRNLVEEQETQAKKHGHVLGCPVHSLGAEISTLDEGLRKRLQEIIAAYLCYYESAIRDAHAQGLIDVPDAAAAARVVFAYTEGVLAHARIANDLERLDEIEAGTFFILGAAPKA